MIISVAGNSLTAGNLGIPYLDYLDLPPAYQIKNHGRDGDTAAGIRRRLEGILQEDQPQILVIQTGANDILLPEMAARGPAWAGFTQKFTAQGSRPSPDEESFVREYRQLLQFLESRETRRVLCTTITPLGENLQSPRNLARERFNQGIRQAVWEAGRELADTALAFEEVLKSNPCPSEWFFESLDDFVQDRRQIRKTRTAMPLSEERGLMLTMDGAHLNERGAELMARVLRPLLLSAS